MEAMNVFSSAVGYLKNHMLTTCKGQLSCIQLSDITWVLTVPAIWTDSSKQFMREAAEKVEHSLHIVTFLSSSILFAKDYIVDKIEDLEICDTDANKLLLNFIRLESVLIS